MYDLIVIGGSAQGLSTAALALEAGVPSVRILEESTSVAYPDFVGAKQLDVAFGERILGLSQATSGDGLAIKTSKGEYETRACVIAANSPEATVDIPHGIDTNARVHAGPLPETESVDGKDILVVGDNDRAVVLAAQYIEQGARYVVLAARGMNPDLLSSASHQVITQLEHDRRLTVLYRATPKSIDGSLDFPLVNFGDHQTPDLQFDHVAFAATQRMVEPEALGLDQVVLETGRVMYVRDSRVQTELPSGTSSEVLTALGSHFSSFSPDVIERVNARRNYRGAPSELAEEFYNATITHFEPTHSDLWVLRVRPDTGGIDHEPGQYSTLALGHWEPRVDGEIEHDIDDVWDTLIRRAYSISHRIFDERGYLANETENGELEFYIVLVPSGQGHLTPRLALKKTGDRIFLGAKVAGHYTLPPYLKPTDTVLFFATGTGEAPHNSMIVQLLRMGHTGKIISAVSVRELQDFGYLDQHRKLEERFPNYTYIPMPTREADIPKRYCQDLIRDGELEEMLGHPIDPSSTHAYLCGNPAMIGAPPKGSDVIPQAEPGKEGLVQLLDGLGLTIHRRGQPGNIHFETYW